MAQQAPASAPEVKLSPAGKTSKANGEATISPKADKVAELINKVNELAQKYEGIKQEVQAAMNKRTNDKAAIMVGMMTEVQRLSAAKFYGSEVLQQTLQRAGKPATPPSALKPR